MKYIDADTLDECREALRLGCQLEYLAGKLRCTPSHLAKLLDLPVNPAARLILSTIWPMPHWLACKRRNPRQPWERSTRASQHTFSTINRSAKAVCRSTSIMATNADDDQRHCLDDEQKIDARQAIGCGLPVAQVAKHFGLSEERLRIELGMPVWRSLPMDRQRRLFDCEVSE